MIFIHYLKKSSILVLIYIINLALCSSRCALTFNKTDSVDIILGAGSSSITFNTSITGKEKKTWLLLKDVL